MMYKGYVIYRDPEDGFWYIEGVDPTEEWFVSPAAAKRWIDKNL